MTQAKRERYRRKEIILEVLDWGCLGFAVVTAAIEGPMYYTFGLIMFSMFFQSHLRSLKVMQRVDELESVVFNIGR